MELQQFIIILLFSFLLLLPLSSLACFSSRNPEQGNPEAASLRRDSNSENSVVLEEIKQKPAEERNHLDGEHEMLASNEEMQLDPAFIKTYLQEFGHLRADSREQSANGGAQLSNGIRHFQDFMGFKSSGRMDLPTLQRMLWKRCANPDDGYNGAPHIWERASLFWKLASEPPTGFTRNEMKELINQAFRAWEIVIAMDFLETQNADEAQIVFEFVDLLDAKRHRNGSKTGLGVAASGSPPSSRIVLSKTEKWSTFQTQEEGKLDIFLVLIHEIGHSLGLKHSGDANSVMFPMFERPVGEQLPVISNDDVERLRALYEGDQFMHQQQQQPVPLAPELATPKPSAGPPAAVPPAVGAQGTAGTAGTAGTSGTKGKSADDGKEKAPEKCPKSLWTVANVNPDTLMVFKEGNVWHFYKGQLAGGPYQISEFFPDGPDFVDVAFSSGRLTILVKSRTLFGYEYDAQTSKFSRARGYPRELHNRILFYPEAAFPIANGSIILIKDNVFATYNVESNTPHMLGAVDEFFPGLPRDLRSGFPAAPDFSTYHMLTQQYAFLYDVRITRSVSSQSIAQFLGCEAVAPQPPPPTQQQFSSQQFSGQQQFAAQPQPNAQQQFGPQLPPQSRTSGAQTQTFGQQLGPPSFSPRFVQGK